MPPEQHPLPPERLVRSYYQLPKEMPRIPLTPRDPDAYVELLRNKFGQDGLYVNYMEQVFLLNRNIVPNYSGSENRKHLWNDGGIVFANHPGNADPAIILRAMAQPDRKIRDDFVILLNQDISDHEREREESRRGYEDAVKAFGQKHFLPATRLDPKPIFNRAIENINKGGVFIIFPTGFEEIKNRKFKFENGLAYLLENLGQDKMVYSFFINRNDSWFADEWGEGGEIKVHEAYSTAQEWQQAMGGGPNRVEKSKLLRQHFVEVHNEDRGLLEID